MIARLFAIWALLAGTISLTVVAVADPTATLSVVITSSGSGLTAPPQATNAGFTTLLANLDFEHNSLCVYKYGSSSQTCYTASNVSSWLDCTGTISDTTKLLFSISVGGTQMPCSRMGVATDPVTGVQSFFMQTQPGDGANFHGHLNSDVYYGTTPGLFTAPLTWYVEQSVRVDATWSSTTDTGPTDAFLFTSRSNTGCSWDYQPGELYPPQNGFASSDANYWCPSKTGIYLWNSISGHPNFPTGWSITGNHIYGGLRTSNGATNGSILTCAYIDNTFIVDPSEGNGCVERGPSGGGILSGVRTGYQVEAGTGTNAVPVTYNLWIRWVRFWTCAGGATGDCFGSTLVGSAGNGSPSYWH